MDTTPEDLTDDQVRLLLSSVANTLDASRLLVAALLDQRTVRQLAAPDGYQRCTLADLMVGDEILLELIEGDDEPAPFPVQDPPVTRGPDGNVSVTVHRDGITATITGAPTLPVYAYRPTPGQQTPRQADTVRQHTGTRESAQRVAPTPDQDPPAAHTEPTPAPKTGVPGLRLPGGSESADDVLDEAERQVRDRGVPGSLEWLRGQGTAQARKVPAEVMAELDQGELHRLAGIVEGVTDGRVRRSDAEQIAAQVMGPPVDRVPMTATHRALLQLCRALLLAGLPDHQATHERDAFVEYDPTMPGRWALTHGAGRDPLVDELPELAALIPRLVDGDLADLARP